jgi:hypothetical protein
LGYKSNVGRGIKYFKVFEEQVNKNIQTWYKNLSSAMSKCHLCLDTNAVHQLKPRRIFVEQNQYDMVFMGTDGTYTCFIDAVNQEFTQSSICTDRKSFDGYDLIGAFAEIRKGLSL